MPASEGKFHGLELQFCMLMFDVGRGMNFPICIEESDESSERWCKFALSVCTRPHLLGSAWDVIRRINAARRTHPDLLPVVGGEELVERAGATRVAREMCTAHARRFTALGLA